MAGIDRRRRSGPRDRLRRAPAVDGRRRRARASSSRRVLGGLGALLVLAFVFASFLAVVPILMAIASIMTTFLLLLGLTDVHGRLADRAVPDRADRARRGDRLLAAGRLALARGARARPQRRRGGAAGDGDRRPRGGLQRHHRRDRPAGADRAAAAVPALDGLRRHADPARLDAGGDHAAAGRSWRRPGRGSTGRTGAPTTRRAAPGPAGHRPSRGGAGSPPAPAWP